MRGSHAVRIAGEAVELLGDRALLWPSRSRLLIADLHLGKGDVFRRAGIGLPAGGTLHDLRRLTRLLEETGASELWILGDILHGAAPMAPWREQWARWRGRHPRVRVTGVAGNHDRALADAALEIELAAGCVEDGAFALRHEPLPHPRLHVICGHLHPLVALPGMRRRWPAFWLRERVTALPAFSHFTAGVVAEPASGERLVACVEGEAIALPMPGPYAPR
ncbi:MAG TPA: ligase-associated DNA damage response endonuclease PdeM [Pseudoxanthomonas sp.]|nr:ligase-associated DNA damage response endonuclease PdeM [Pseudoxanthomonas sp.]